MAKFPKFEDGFLPLFGNVKKTGENKWQTICPAHDDHNPSLDIAIKNDKVLLHCFGGCDTEDVLEAVGLTFKDLYRSYGVEIDKTKPTPKLETIKASEIEPLPVQWFWKNRIPANMITLLFGNSEVGKSILTSDMAARTTRVKSKWPDGTPCRRGSVLIFSSEEDKERTLVPRLKAMGAVMNRITFAKGVIEKKGKRTWFDIKENLPSLEQYLKRNKQIRLVIIDPVTAYLSRRGRDENLEIRNALGPLEELAEKYKATIMLVTHMNKRIDTSAPALHRAIGSIAYGAIVRSAWIVLKDSKDEDRRLLLKAKLSVGVAQLGLAFKIKQTGDWASQVIVDWENGFVAETADEILNSKLGRPPSKAERAKELIEEALEKGPVKQLEMQSIAKDNEINWRTMMRAKSDIAVESYKVKNRWWWKKYES